MRRFPILLSLASVMTMFSTMAVSQDLDARRERTKDIFGELFGLTLVIGVEKACTHAQEVGRTANPDNPTLLMTNEGVTEFYDEPCDGTCDVVQTNNILARCRSERNIEGCIIYGAAFNDELYDVSIDPTGASLADCTP